MRSSSLPARAVLGALLITGLATGGVLAVPLSASAATMAVSSSADSGPGTLRDLVDNYPLVDVITIPASITSILLETEILITRSLTIAGPGPSLVIDRGVATGNNLFSAQGNALTDVDITLSGMTLTASPGDLAVGIGTTSIHDLTLDNVTVQNQSYSAGAGLYVYFSTGDVNIIDSTFIDNSGYANFQGGAARLEAFDNLTVTGSHFEGNTAGGAGALYATAMIGAMTIDSTTFVDNHAVGVAPMPFSAVPDGGAMYVDNIFLDSTITNSSFLANTSSAHGGGLRVGTVHDARLDIATSTFAGNDSVDGGGGLSVGGLDGSVPNGLQVTASAFYDNSTENTGSSIEVGLVDAPFLLQNSTVDDRLTGLGAVYVNDVNSSLITDAFAILSSTITGPGGVVLDTATAGTTLIDHSILVSSNGLPAVGITNPGAILIALNRDLLSSALDPAIANDAGGKSLFSIANMRLAPIADNGGPTLTRLPADNSPAHNGGDPAYAGPSAFDQRGTGYLRQVQAIDIGAVELQTLALAATGASVNPWLPISGAILLVIGVGAFLLARRTRRKA